MENYRGEIWKDFIRNEIAPGRLFSQMPENTDISPYVQTSAQTRDEFLDGLITEAATCRDETQLKGMVSGYQALICFMINQVHGYLRECESRPECTALYEAVIVDLEASLQFIKDYFPTYFDQAAFAPKSQGAALRRVLQRIEAAVKRTSDRSGQDAQLGELLLLEIQKLSEGQLSFVQLSYLNTFLDGFLKAIELHTPLWLQSRLTEYCILKNFNTSVVLEHMFFRMTETLSGLDTAEEKREWLLGYQKQLYQHPLEQELSLNGNLPTVRDYLINWIEQENLFWQAGQNKESAALAEPVPKMHTSVSVPVLALLTRVFKESGVFTNKNLQEVFRFVSAHYTSQRKESISPGNFHGKYYTVEETTKRKVTDLLLEMVKVVRKIP